MCEGALSASQRRQRDIVSQLDAKKMCGVRLPTWVRISQEIHVHADELRNEMTNCACVFFLYGESIMLSLNDA